MISVKTGTAISTKAKSMAFTLIELLIVVSVISTLAALLLPALRRAAESARKTSCMNNQRQMAVAYQNYSDDYNGYLPPAYIDHGNGYKTFWRRVFATYVGLESEYWVWAYEVTPYTCPTNLSLHPERTDGYAQNGASTRLVESPKLGFPKKPDRNLLNCDGRWRDSGPYWETVINKNLLPDFAHRGAVNVLFYDSHVETVRQYDFPITTGNAEGQAFWYGE